MAYSCFRRRNKNLIMQIKVSWETKTFFIAKKGGKNYDDRKENRAFVKIKC